jgi:hypothetical protein
MKFHTMNNLLSFMKIEMSKEDKYYKARKLFNRFITAGFL